MCGIVGWASRERPMDRAAFDGMIDSLAHRGPDGRGAWFDRGGRIALGHRRLSIVDLTEAGAQPMSLPEAGLHLTFNGEIYNHPELRETLEARGAVYRSRCDSETILHAYAEWGPSCVERFRGIFAFALWDEREGRLFAARDHVGVKPLYLRDGPDGLAFASQPRAFVGLPGFTPEIDPDGFLDALTYGVVPGHRGAYRGATKLPPGHRLIWRDGETRIERYWAPAEGVEIFDAREAEAAVAAAVEEAVALQLMADVPVATFLSGGIDSSVVTACAVETTGPGVKSFTIGFDEGPFDERPYAARAAEYLGVEPVVETLRPEDMDRAIEDAVEAFDEPFAIDAALPMTAISRLAASRGTKVVLAGDGADELFAGYRHYDALAARYRRHGRGDGGAVASRARAFAADLIWGGFDPLAVYKSHNAQLNGPVAARMAGEALEGRRSQRWREEACFRRDLGPVEAARRCDLATYLPDEILVKVDRATMAFGIEARVPFLDPAMIDLAFRIDPALHYQGGERKAVLKRAARRWLPQDILSARKKGFSPPLVEWAGVPEMRRRMLETVSSGVLVSGGWLRGERLAEAVDGLARPAAALFQLYLLERWAQRWVVGVQPSSRVST